MCGKYDCLYIARFIGLERNDVVWVIYRSRRDREEREKARIKGRKHRCGVV